MPSLTKEILEQFEKKDVDATAHSKCLPVFPIQILLLPPHFCRAQAIPGTKPGCNFGLFTCYISS